MVGGVRDVIRSTFYAFIWRERGTLFQLVFSPALEKRITEIRVQQTATVELSTDVPDVQC